MELLVIFRDPSSFARIRIITFTPALLDVYMAYPAWG